MITIKTNNEIKILREGGKILGGILKELGDMVKPGVTTEDLEIRACDLINKAGGRPAFKGYKTGYETRGFPTALCTSINDEIVHAPALPARTLNEGDIIGIDVGMEYPFNVNDKESVGLYTDTAITVAVGEVDKKIQKLIKVTKNSLMLAINQVRPGGSLNDIGVAVQKHAEENGYSVVRDLVGHGVGHSVHEEPQVPNFAIHGSGLRNAILKPGMVLAIEPMVNVGEYSVKGLDDGFTIATADGSLSAHFEHTVVVTDDGFEILTLVN